MAKGGAMGPTPVIPMYFPYLSAQHSPKHSASAAQQQYGKKVPGHSAHSVIDDQGKDEQDEKIQSAHQKSPQELAAPFPLSGKKAGKKGDDDVDADNTQGYDLFRQAEAVEEQSQQKEQSGGKKVGYEQTF